MLFNLKIFKDRLAILGIIAFTQTLPVFALDQSQEFFIDFSKDYSCSGTFAAYSIQADHKQLQDEVSLPPTTIGFEANDEFLKVAERGDDGLLDPIGGWYIPKPENCDLHQTSISIDVHTSIESGFSSAQCESDHIDASYTVRNIGYGGGEYSESVTLEKSQEDSTAFIITVKTTMKNEDLSTMEGVIKATCTPEK